MPLRCWSWWHFFISSTPLHLGTGSRKVQYDVHSKTTFECSVASVSFSVAQSKSCHLKYWMFSVLPFQLSCDLVKDDGVRFIYHVGSWKERTNERFVWFSLLLVKGNCFIYQTFFNSFVSTFESGRTDNQLLSLVSNLVWSTGREILFWRHNKSIQYDFLQSGNSAKLTPGG